MAEKMRAWQLTAKNAEYLRKLTDGRLVEEIDPESGDLLVGLNFPGQEAIVRASEGDFVVHTELGSWQRWSEKAFRDQFERSI